MKSLIKDSLKWVTIFLVTVTALCFFEEWKVFGLFLGATIIYCMLLGVYAYLQIRQEYLRDPEASQLIGRMTYEIDHKGKGTQRIIW
jgi:hypothetical protein